LNSLNGVYGTSTIRTTSEIDSAAVVQDGSSGGNLGLLEAALRKVSAEVTREARHRNCRLESDGMTDSTIARKLVSAIGACALLLSGALQPALACTGIRLIAEDGTAVHARTLEFGLDLHSEIMMVPRGYARTARHPTARLG
jgi:hypothetical protein